MDIKINNFFSSGLLKGLICRLFLLMIFIAFLRLFIFEIYYVPSSSMEPTLKKGDYIFVSKIHYGFRLPRNILEVPYLKIIGYSFFSKQKIRELQQSNKPYKRFNFFSKVKTRDIIVFNNMMDQQSFMVKRCNMVPKDTLHKVSYKLLFYKRIRDDKDSLRDIVIPWKGMPSIEDIKYIGKKNQIYKKIINKQGREVAFFKNNYYYMLGDNSKESRDSRFWGLLQGDHIVGKAVFILYSSDEKDKIRWSRIFKKIL